VRPLSNVMDNNIKVFMGLYTDRSQTYDALLSENRDEGRVGCDGQLHA
jgi:hypothetical protein